MAKTDASGHLRSVKGKAIRLLMDVAGHGDEVVFRVLAGVDVPLFGAMVDETDRGIPLEGFRNAGQFFGHKFIIRVEQADDFSSRAGKAKIESRRLSAIMFLKV